MISLRLVVDTNIVISAALKPEGLQRTVLLLAITKPSRLYVSAPILEEYRTARFVRPVRHLQVTTDPDDNMFVECADVAGVDYLITGNIRHFPRYWKRTKIITSREFLSVIAPHLLT